MQNGVLNIIASHGLGNPTPTRYNGKPIFAIYYDAAHRFFIRSSHGLGNPTPTHYNGKPIFAIYYDAARRFFIRSFVFRIINAKLTVLTFRLTPPPPA